PLPTAAGRPGGSGRVGGGPVYAGRGPDPDRRRPNLPALHPPGLSRRGEVPAPAGGGPLGDLRLDAAGTPADGDLFRPELGGDAGPERGRGGGGPPAPAGGARATVFHPRARSDPRATASGDRGQPHAVPRYRGG